MDMTTNHLPSELKSNEDLRALLGRKITLEFDYQAKASRKKYAPMVTRTERTVGTIELDTRVPALERYIIQRNKHGQVIYPQGQRVVKVS